MSGIGQALIVDLKELARRDGVAEIELDVVISIPQRQPFLQRQGFEIVRERRSTPVDTV